MSSSPSKTVNRLVQLLESFTWDKPTWTLAELGEHLGLPRSTIHRMLVALEHHGILRRGAEDQRWRYGYRLSVWGQLASESSDLQRLARAAMKGLVEATGETSLITVYRDRQVICIDKIETNHSVRLALQVGRRQAPHAGASCKVLMAYLPQEEIEAIIHQDGLAPLCVNTLTDPEALVVELAKIRDSGYALSVEETDPGAWGVGTPIFDRRDQVIAAIGVVGPTMRFSDEIVRDYVELCRDAARRISSTLIKGSHS